MNSTCIHHEGSRPEYIHVHVLENIHKISYTTEKLQKIHIHLTDVHVTSHACESLGFELLGVLPDIFIPAKSPSVDQDGSGGCRIELQGALLFFFLLPL